MATLSAEVRLLEEYQQNIQDVIDHFDWNGGDADKRRGKEIDKKMPIYLKQAQLVRAEFPESDAGAFHESTYHVFRAIRVGASSVLARRMARNSGNMVTGLAAAGVAKAQEKANATKAIGILDEALSICDTARARFVKAGVLEVLGRKDEAISEYRYLIKNFPDSEDIYVDARKALDALENPPKKGPCFVATACYGDYDHPDVRTFREWRDSRLLPTRHGRLFVRLYYRVGPLMAQAIEGSPRLGATLRNRLLEGFARRLRRSR